MILISITCPYNVNIQCSRKLFMHIYIMLKHLSRVCISYNIVQIMIYTRSGKLIFHRLLAFPFLSHFALIHPCQCRREMNVTYGTHNVLQVSDPSSEENVNYIKSHKKTVVFRVGKFVSGMLIFKKFKGYLNTVLGFS